MLTICSCGKQLDVADDLVGRWVRCPKCRQKMKVKATDDLPLALDREPQPEELIARATEALGGAAATERGLTPQAAGELHESLGDLAAAVGQVNGHDSAPVPAGPREAGDAPPLPPTADASEDLSALAAAATETAGTGATGRPAPRAVKAKPAASSATRRAARGAKPRVAMAAADDQEEPAAKRRDLLPIIISGAAALVFLAILVGAIVARSGGGASDGKKPAAGQPQPLPAVPSYADGKDSVGGSQFFGGVGHPSSTEYLRQKAEREKAAKETESLPSE